MCDEGGQTDSFKQTEIDADRPEWLSYDPLRLARTVWPKNEAQFGLQEKHWNAQCSDREITHSPCYNDVFLYDLLKGASTELVHVHKYQYLRSCSADSDG